MPYRPSLRCAILLELMNHSSQDTLGLVGMQGQVLIPWEEKEQIPMDSMICMETFGSGCKISWSENLQRGVDHLRRSSGSDRVIRGGSWYNYAQFLRSASRGNVNPGFRNYDVGLRLVRTL